MAVESSRRQAQTIFEQILGQPKEERLAWLADACQSDTLLKQEVEDLLAAHDRSEGVMDAPKTPLDMEGAGEEQVAAAAGEKVGPYHIVAEIGRGGMGVVYKAQDPRLNRLVALKLLPPSLTANKTAKQRLLAEARAASALDHPNICTVYDIGQGAEGQMFMAMAVYEGRTLSEKIGDGPLSLPEAIGVAIEVARGLAHAHEASVTHRDIKPSNILLTERGGVKILDFGLAKQGLVTLTDPGTRLGTVAYMPPEQALGKKVDRRADIWSLGVVLYEMVTGRNPFPGEYQDAILYAIVHEAAQPVPASMKGLPLAWEQIVNKSLEKAPEDRYQSADAVLQDLCALQTEIQYLSQPESTAVQTDSGGPIADTAGATSASKSGASRQGFVGREKERAELRGAYDNCVGGRGAVVCVSGEPGIGKTTLVEGFLASLSKTTPSCYIARGRCSERLAGTEAYLPILEALESLLRADSGGFFARVMKEHAPTWYVQIAPVSAASDASFAAVLEDAKVASQERMKRELNAFLQELSRGRPVVIFCDDLHWADVSTVDMLSYIGNRSDRMRVLVLGTYRPSDMLLAKHPFLPVKRELQSRGLCRELTLEFLSEENVQGYLDLAFAGHRFPPFLASLVHSRTEGNPLFMTDLLRDLRDRGVIAQRDEHWVLARPVPEIKTDLPESIRGMIERKIDKLDEEDGRLLAAASVQGQEFDSSTVSAAIGTNVNDIEEQLEDLVRVHRFVRLLDERELPDGTLTQRYSFVHALYQNTLYGRLRTRQRAALSAAIAEALLTSHAEKSSEIASDLAHLFETAREFEKAVDYFLAAADQAASVYASREVEKLVLRAISNAEKLTGRPRLVRLLEAANRLGQVHLTLSRLEDAVTAFDLAEKTAAELGDVEAQVTAICSGANARFNLRRIEETRESGRRALEIARAAGSERGAAAAGLVLGLVDMGLGQVVDAQASFDRAVPVLRDQGAPLHALEAMTFAGMLHAWQLDYAKAGKVVNWTLERARSLGTPYHIVMNLFMRGMALFNEGRLGEGLADLEEGMRLAEVTNERYWLSRYPNTLAWAYQELQEPEKALRLNHEGAAIAHENGFGKPEAQSHVNLGQMYLDLGEPQRALEHLQRAEEIFNQDVWFRWRYYIRLKATFASYWITRGDTKKAAVCASESLEFCRPRKARKHMAWAHKLLGDIAVMEERFEDGRREYAAALETLKNHQCPTVEWKVFLAAAEMASAYGNVPLAERYRGECRALIHALAGSVAEDKLRRQFLGSRMIRSVST